MGIRITRILEDHRGLTLNFKVNPISCTSHKHYEEYIRYNAIDDQVYGMATTHILLDEDKREILGFVTLKASSLMFTNSSERVFGYPAIEIFEIAVDEKYERLGYGTDLVNYVFTLADDLRDYLGIEYIVLCADPESIKFYEKFGFSEIENYHEVPKEMKWNENCIPLFLKLP